MSRAFTLIRSLLYIPVFYGWAAIASLIIYIAAKIGGYGPLLSYWGRVWVKGAALIERYILGLTYRLEGWENMPDYPCIIAMQHQSEWETMKLFLWFERPAIVLKEELLNVPLWGPAMKSYGAIPVARSGKPSDLKNLVKAAAERAAQKRPIIIYPQGTRTPPGTIRELQRGVGVLYDQLKIPVVPVTLNSGEFWGREAFLKYPGVIDVMVHPAIPPGLQREEMMARLEALYYAAGPDSGAAAGA
jgi:1-acyl-sn-glycerol-3-phosphate acyltransferase